MYDCAVEFTILTKKLKSISQTTVFHIAANEKSHFFAWEEPKKNDCLVMKIENRKKGIQIIEIPYR